MSRNAYIMFTSIIGKKIHDLWIRYPFTAGFGIEQPESCVLVIQMQTEYVRHTSKVS